MEKLVKVVKGDQEKEIPENYLRQYIVAGWKEFNGSGKETVDESNDSAENKNPTVKTNNETNLYI